MRHWSSLLASSVSSLSKTPTFQSSQNAGWLSLRRGRLSRGSCWQEHRRLNRCPELARKQEGESSSFCTPMISGATTSATRPEALSSFGLLGKNHMALLPCSQICTATCGISCSQRASSVPLPPTSGGCDEGSGKGEGN